MVSSSLYLSSSLTPRHAKPCSHQLHQRSSHQQLLKQSQCHPDVYGQEADVTLSIAIVGEDGDEMLIFNNEED